MWYVRIMKTRTGKKGLSLVAQWRIHLSGAGDMGSIPDPGRSHVPRKEAHGPQLPSLCSRAWEPQLLEPKCPRARAPQQEKLLQWEAHAPQLENRPCNNGDPTQPNKTKQKNLGGGVGGEQLLEDFCPHRRALAYLLKPQFIIWINQKIFSCLSKALCALGILALLLDTLPSIPFLASLRTSLISPTWAYLLVSLPPLHCIPLISLLTERNRT